MYCGLLSFPLERLERDFSGSESKTVKASEIKAPPPFGGGGGKENLEFSLILSPIVNLRLAWAPCLSLKHMIKITK